MLDLREKLDEGILVDGGAIGTLLADRGVAQPCSVREKLADLCKTTHRGTLPRWPGVG